jgi:hypothetical protein
MNQFDPLTTLNRLLRGWWVMVLLAVLGAVLGRLAATALPPVYRAQAEYYVSVDHVAFAEERGLEHVMAIDVKDTNNAVADISMGDEVVDTTVRLANDAGISITADEFREQAHLDRYYTNWLFTVYDDDAQAAAMLANLWVQSTDTVLQEALHHAIAAHELSLELGLLGRCFDDNDLAGANACAGTSYASVAEFSAALTDLQSRYEAEWDASQRIDHTMQLEPLESASAPSGPIRNAPSMLLLGGAVLGWVIGLSLAMAGFPPKKKRS